MATFSLLFFLICWKKKNPNTMYDFEIYVACNCHLKIFNMCRWRMYILFLVYITSFSQHVVSTT